MAKARDYEAAANWAEHKMTLKPDSTTVLRGDEAAKRGRDVLTKTVSGRPSRVGSDQVSAPTKRSAKELGRRSK